LKKEGIMDQEKLNQFIENNISWLGQSGVRIKTESGLVIYIDPFQIKNDTIKADYIFITHPHGDHYNPKVIKRIKKNNTIIITPLALKDIGSDTMAQNEKRNFGKIIVQTIPAYNKRGFPHSIKKGFLGYIIGIDDLSVFHGGDTDFIPEMKGLNPDIAFIPVTGFVTMNYKDAAKAAKEINAKITIPIHYGLLPVGRKNGENFINAYSGKSLILKPEK
jgi:L-ascorbate metabolism protein UlaG (beta-lactamase superfamily)